MAINPLTTDSVSERAQPALSRERCHLTDHARLDSIPLRLGRPFGQRKIYVAVVALDPEGTKNQKFQEIERGNEHVIADLWTSPDEGEHLGRWRLVIGRPKEHFQDRPVITVLPEDRQQTKAQSEVSSLLRTERESGKHAWLDESYVAEILHPLYRDGRLRTQADLSEHIRAIDKKPLLEAVQRMGEELFSAKRHAEEESARRNEAEAEVAQLKEAIRKSAQESLLHSASSAADEAPEPATRVTNYWRSRTVDSKYENVGIEAHILDVETRESKIFLTYIGSKGRPKKIDDFGYRGLVKDVYEYLKSYEGRRAVFIVTYKEDKVVRLASDTMMLPTYRDLWLN